MPLRDSWKQQKPGLNPDAIREIEKLISKESRVFEFGTGGSTVWFTKRVGKLVSVEYDPEWFRILHDGIVGRFGKIPKNLELKLASQTQHNLWVMSETTRQQIGLDFIQAIVGYPDDYFDLVLVDGRARVSCMLSARRKVKPGGTIILDDSERPQYKQGIVQMGDWSSRIFDDKWSGRHTTFFTKPPQDTGMTKPPQNILFCVKIYPEAQCPQASLLT